MKKLITALLILLAAGVYAGGTPTVYCDCVGIGMPEKKPPLITGHQPKSVKYEPVTFNQHIFLEVQLLWLYYHGIYK